MSRLGHITKGWVTAQVGKLYTFTAVENTRGKFSRVFLTQTYFELKFCKRNFVVELYT